jgi:hypothetical protein
MYKTLLAGGIISAPAGSVSHTQQTFPAGPAAAVAAHGLDAPLPGIGGMGGMIPVRGEERVCFVFCVLCFVGVCVCVGGGGGAGARACPVPWFGPHAHPPSVRTALRVRPLAGCCGATV